MRGVGGGAGGGGTENSALFRTNSSLAALLYRPARMLNFAPMLGTHDWSPCLLDADWGLRSDVMANLGLQASDRGVLIVNLTQCTK